MNIAYIGMAAALGISALGSAFGTGAAGQAAVGAWKKCYEQGKQAPFIMIAFAGAPLTQTIDPALAFGIGIFGGIAIGFSALFQGKTAAAASDALGATGKGTANYFIVIGVIETVALFSLVFCMLLLSTAAIA